MFEGFTDRARQVVVLAQDQAWKENRNFIGTDHLLMGLIGEGEGVAAKALESVGVSLVAVRQQVGHSRPAPPAGISGGTKPPATRPDRSRAGDPARQRPLCHPGRVWKLDPANSGDLIDRLRPHARRFILQAAQVGEGWRPLVEECHERLQATFPDYELLAVKQKYGALEYQALPASRHRARSSGRHGNTLTSGQLPEDQAQPAVQKTQGVSHIK